MGHSGALPISGRFIPIWTNVRQKQVPLYDPMQDQYYVCFEGTDDLHHVVPDTSVPAFLRPIYRQCIRTQAGVESVHYEQRENIVTFLEHVNHHLFSLSFRKKGTEKHRKVLKLYFKYLKGHTHTLMCLPGFCAAFVRSCMQYVYQHDLDYVARWFGDLFGISTKDYLHEIGVKEFAVGGQCSICWEEQSHIAQTECDHQFCQACFVQWVSAPAQHHSVTCPCCRATFL